MATFCSLCFSSFVVINQSLIHSKHYYGPISCCNQKISSKLVDGACKHGKYYQTFNDTKINIVIELKVIFICSLPLRIISRWDITTDICNRFQLPIKACFSKMSRNSFLLINLLNLRKMSFQMTVSVNQVPYMCFFNQALFMWKCKIKL